MKTCSICKEDLPLTQFYPRQTGLPELMAACKACCCARNKQQNAIHRDKRKEYDAARGPGWERSGREKWESSGPTKHGNHIERTYGLTGAQFQSLLDKQGGVCAICGSAFSRNSQNERLCVDHDHDTGAVRGLLCFKCNVGLGRFNDEVSRVEKAAAYLRAAADRRAGLAPVFICGPMSGLPDMNYPSFNKAALRVRAMGHRVENPAENKEPPCRTWQGWMRLSIRQLVTCDAVALLPGWEHSRGAKVEEQLALGLGLRVAPIECFLAGDDSVVPPITFSNASPTEPYRAPAWPVRAGGSDHAKHRSRGF